MTGTVSEQLSALDPETDYQEIVYLLQCQAFPWDYERALEFALFRTFAVPSISALLFKTGEFIKRPQKRYDDTELILYEISENGFDSERAQAALKRMNQMHARFPISNEDFLYVLSTFVFEPIRWINQYGSRPLRHNEMQGIFRFYCELGRRMHIRDIPDSMSSLEQYNINYERTHYRYAETNNKIGAATRDLLLSFYLPKLFWPLGKPLINALLDDALCESFGFTKMPRYFQLMVKALVKLRGKIIRLLPERRYPRLGTKVKRPTYPNGYKIEELGTFKRSAPIRDHTN